VWAPGEQGCMNFYVLPKGPPTNSLHRRHNIRQDSPTPHSETCLSFHALSLLSGRGVVWVPPSFFVVECPSRRMPLSRRLGSLAPATEAPFLPLLAVPPPLKTLPFCEPVGVKRWPRFPFFDRFSLSSNLGSFWGSAFGITWLSLPLRYYGGGFFFFLLVIRDDFFPPSCGRHSLEI